MILQIDTSGEIATISLVKDANVIAELSDSKQMNHAAFVQPAIKKILQDNGLALKDLQAVSVTAGPGSYTGLRVGMSSAKGLCYALGLPLITVSTLEVMALAAKRNAGHYLNDENTLICPMIDARRMEVFTAVYDLNLKQVMPPCSLIIEADSFAQLLHDHKIIFTGNGALKLNPVLQHQNLIIVDVINFSTCFAHLSQHYFSLKSFTDVAYSEPLYIKGIYISGK